MSFGEVLFSYKLIFSAFGITREFGENDILQNAKDATPSK